MHIRLRSCTEAETTPTVECGVPLVPPSINSRIIGGSEAVAHSWPWQARVVAAGVECGGSLIDTQFVITAAHCLATNTDPNSWTVILGDHDRRLVEENQETLDVVATIIHSGYDPSTNANDIALLKLKSPVVYTNAISPLCLPEVGDSFADGTECVVTGWGLTSSRATSLSQVLNQVRIPLVSRARCIEYHGDIILRSMICAGLDEGGRDTCQGDSGGPLACKSKGRYVLTGLTSFGRGCAEPESPGVYTRLSSFTAWVADNAIA
ncbi:hypothetical protein CAPTEDRAFT_18116 [Capitella teleta]|uniref:Peptidase S1 domain-containing protein n=1 Tax=Capitella teleta TaxID=283909 RepID=R7URY6_CAPTE|nr:hypothetical protein CAPTEDRAFT_18116 [Capitella teleta]|eukprot:ELU06672.1 hypothetical protein CAPTEDRAFT_18116 [Capitella teleta]